MPDELSESSKLLQEELQGLRKSMQKKEATMRTLEKDPGDCPIQSLQPLN